MTRHLFLTGEKGVGKSTLIRRLLTGASGPVGGFFTVRAVTDGQMNVHLLHPGTGEVPTPENRLFRCGGLEEPGTAERFDAMGCAALRSAPDASVLVMDELGPHEYRARAFCEAVIRALDGGIPILGVLQKAESGFLDAIAAHPGVRVVTVTPENRDKLAQAAEANRERFPGDLWACLGK